MRGERTVAQEALSYSVSLKRRVPADHLLRSIDRFVDLSGIREELKPFYRETGRPSIDPELMIRMLIIGYCMGIRSERRLCDEVHWNLAYHWFCRSAPASRGLDTRRPRTARCSWPMPAPGRNDRWSRRSRRAATTSSSSGSTAPRPQKGSCRWCFIPAFFTR